MDIRELSALSDLDIFRTSSGFKRTGHQLWSGKHAALSYIDKDPCYYVSYEYSYGSGDNNRPTSRACKFYIKA